MDSISVTYEMSESTFIDINKRFISKVLKFKQFGICISVLSALITVFLIYKKLYSWIIFPIFLIACVLTILITAKRRLVANAKASFAMSAQDGIMRYDLELTETELISRNVAKGDIAHIARSTFTKAYDLGDCVIVQFSTTVAVPILKNAETQAIIDALVPKKKVYVAVEK